MKILKRPKASSIFKSYQTRADVPLNSMILDCEVRWGSAFHMCKRVLQQKIAIRLAEDNAALAIPAEIKVSQFQKSHG